MDELKFKYDVAFSFLKDDEQLATHHIALAECLSKNPLNCEKSASILTGNTLGKQDGDDARTGTPFYPLSNLRITV